MAAGRKRRQGVPRGKTNRIKTSHAGETPDEAMATVRLQRMKRGASAQNFRAAEWECPLGILFLDTPNGLSRDQYDAGCTYRNIVRQYRMIIGAASPTPRSIDLVGVRGGSPQDWPEEFVRSIREKYALCQTALAEVGREIGDIGAPKKSVDMVCVDEAIPPGSHRMQLLGNLRSGLNAIHRALRG